MGLNNIFPNIPYSNGVFNIRMEQRNSLILNTPLEYIYSLILNTPLEYIFPNIKHPIRIYIP